MVLLGCWLRHGFDFRSVVSDSLVKLEIFDAWVDPCSFLKT